MSMKEGKKMPKISVIIPVYNVEDYLAECLKSVVEQTFDDFEVLVINDGSPDHSQKIIDQYVKKYPFVHSFIKENGGLSSARNYGLKKSKAKYVYFLDGDDFIAPNLLQSCYDKIKETDADVVYFDFFEYYSSENMRILPGLKNVCGEKKKQFMVSPPAAWNKVFRKNLFLDHEIFFPEGKWYEDLATTPRILIHAEKLEYLNEPLYYYRQREGSIMKTVNPKMFQMYDVIEILRDYFKKEHCLDSYGDALEIQALLNLVFVCRTLSCSDMEDKWSRQLDVLNYLKKYYPKWSKNAFYKQEKWYTRLHIQILLHKGTLKLYNWIRGLK